MRVVVDTNVLVSALIAPGHPPALLVDAWLERAFEILISRQQLDEIVRVTRYSKVAKRIRRAEAGQLINSLCELAVLVDRLSRVEQSPDPADDNLLALAWAGKADYLVSGDKSDLLALVKFRQTRIVSARRYCRILRLLP